MTWDKFRAALDAVGWSQAELGRRLGRSATAVSQWKSAGVPRYAVAYLELAVAVRRALG